jgi:orotate phosphoribosyltransferase-like protein
VLTLAARDGLTRKEVADRLGISDGTVKEHIETAMRKLDAPSTANAWAKLSASDNRAAVDRAIGFLQAVRPDSKAALNILLALAVTLQDSVPE